jgi:uncharacterized membrane protein
MEQPLREVTIGKWINEGWEMVKSDFWNFVLVSLLFYLISGACSLILMGPMMCSFYYIIFRKMRGEKIEIGDIAKGFSFFLPALLANLVIGIFTGAGFLCCIIPGLVISAMYSFVYPLIIEKNLGFWDAMEESRKIIWPNIWRFTLFVIVATLVAVAGVLLCFVGILVTIPICFCAYACAYRDWVGLAEQPVGSPSSM